MALDPDQPVEVLYESDWDSSRDMEPRVRFGDYPSTVIRAERLFRLVRYEIVSRSGECTRLRVRYRTG
jgi:hypothetical protein